MAALFAITVFVSAALLFWVQPMVAKMVLPLLGGTPAVWNTCMVFFQAVLLAGYAYSHWIGRRSNLRAQVFVHLGLLTVAALALPIGISPRAVRWLPSESNPAAWLLVCLLLSTGLPFFALATNGPLLQRWFSYSRHPSAQDPYFLYAASNLGSLVALLGYPLVLEPDLTLRHQSWWWTIGFGLLVLLIGGAGLFIARRRLPAGNSAVSSESSGQSVGHCFSDSGPIRGRQRWRWCFLAFIPSSLMLGVTTYVTTDIASLPLLWVLPMGAYLLSFVLVFGRAGRVHQTWACRAFPIGAIALSYILLSEATEPMWLLLVVHVAAFFIAALVCHGQLASERPSARHLTEFYLWIASGGVLGGIFNALAAPLLFRHVVEYPALLVLACFCCRNGRPLSTRPSDRFLDVLIPAGIAALALVIRTQLSREMSLPLQVQLGLGLGVPLLACYSTVTRPARFGLGLTGVMLASAVSPGIHGRPLHAERNFFGVLRVTRDPIGPFYRLVHGSTVHGREWIDPARWREPLSYYHRSGPLGQIFHVYQARRACTNVGVVGLGAGSMASYATGAEKWTFYEINPAVVRVASNTNYFHFLSGCAAGKVEMVLGDARVRLVEAPPESYGLLVLDAFSSDSIPLHLVTREALALYLSRLAHGGLLVFHISNRCLDLQGVLADLATDAKLVCSAQDEVDPSPEELAQGKDQSHWLVMARRPEDLGRLNKDARWVPLRGSPGARVWTDDYSNIISVFNWR